MVKTKCLDGAALDAFLDARRTGKGNPAVDAHLQTCGRCAALVGAATDPRTEKLNEGARRVGKLLSRPRPEKIERGQIWRLTEQPGGRFPIGVITRGPEIPIDPERPDVRMSRCNFEATTVDLAANDVVVEEKESPLAMRFLVEHWNDRVIPESLLETCLGNLAKAAWNRLAKALADRGPESRLSPQVRAFRTQAVREAESLSVESPAKAFSPAKTEVSPSGRLCGWRHPDRRCPGETLR